MPPVYIDSPRTEISDTSRLSSIHELDFSIEPSFHSPAKRNNGLVAQARSNKTTSITNKTLAASALRTPNIRTALNDRRNPPAKAEFTPLLKSATKNRKSQRDAVLLQPRDGGLETPAALKPNYNFDTPRLPELSMVNDSSSLSIGNDQSTPMAPAVSSSVMSTPLPEIQAEGGAALDGGNILTLREQEVKLEQIDKENFGLKLKIHFLEENLKRSGSEFNQETIKENTDLKVDRVTLQRDIKIQRKSLVEAQQQLAQYRGQLRQYTNAVKERHADEAMQEEMEELRKVAEERAVELERLRDELNNRNDDTEVGRLQDDVKDMEMELREKDRIIDSKDDEIEALQDKVQQDRESGNQDQEDRIHDLEQRLQQVIDEKEAEIDHLHEELQNIQAEKDDDLVKEKESSIAILEKKLALAQREHTAEVEALEDRVRLAESSGSNKLQLVQQAAHDAREEVQKIRKAKDEEIEYLQSQVDNARVLRDQLDKCRKEIRELREDSQLTTEKVTKQDELMRQLRTDNSNLERELSTARSQLKEQRGNLGHLEQLQNELHEKNEELSSLQKATEDRRIAHQELSKLQSKMQGKEAELELFQQKARDCNSAKEEVKRLRQSLQQREAEMTLIHNSPKKPSSQIETLQKIINDRGTELENMRNSLNEQMRNIDDAQNVANSRKQEIDSLKRETANMKELHEEEIEVLESSIDEAEEARAKLEKEITTLKRNNSDSTGLRSKVESLEDSLHATQQAKTDAERELKSLKLKLQRTEKSRDELHDEISTLESELNQVQSSTSNEKAAANERRELQDLLKNTRFEAEKLQSQIADKDDMLEAAKLEIREMMKAQERRARATKKDAKQSVEVITLKDEIMDRDKRHRSELKGLAKQIQYLRARCTREEGFRGSLAYSKRFFLMQIEMYNACNKADLRLLEEMGLTPDESIRQKKASLRTTAWAVIAALRMKKMTADWASCKELQRSLLRKLDQVRGHASKA